jgi:hypothetical protein
MSFETTANREDTRTSTRRSASLAATRRSRGNRRDCADLDQRTRQGQATVYTDEMFEAEQPAQKPVPDRPEHLGSLMPVGRPANGQVGVAD